MTTELFEKKVEEILNRVKNILVLKNKEYTPNAVNRLYNFYRGAEIQRISTLHTWRGYFTKHLVSLLDIIEHPESFSYELIKEKIQDLIAYLILFECLYVDENEIRKE